MEGMEFNHGAIRYEIKEQYKTYKKFAEALGITGTKLSNLLCGKTSWTDEMIFRVATMLSIEENVWEYFFTPKTHKSYTHERKGNK